MSQASKKGSSRSGGVGSPPSGAANIIQWLKGLSSKDRAQALADSAIVYYVWKQHQADLAKARAAFKRQSANNPGANAGPTQRSGMKSPGVWYCKNTGFVYLVIYDTQTGAANTEILKISAIVGSDLCPFSRIQLLDPKAVVDIATKVVSAFPHWSLQAKLDYTTLGIADKYLDVPFANQVKNPRLVLRSYLVKAGLKKAKPLPGNFASNFQPSGSGKFGPIRGRNFSNFLIFDDLEEDPDPRTTYHKNLDRDFDRAEVVIYTPDGIDIYLPKMSGHPQMCVQYKTAPNPSIQDSLAVPDSLLAERQRLGRVTRPHLIVRRDALWFVTPYNPKGIAALKAEFPAYELMWRPDDKVWVLPFNPDYIKKLYYISANSYLSKLAIITADDVSLADLKSGKILNKQSYYTILEVEETATRAEIRDAFRGQVKKYHPDKGGNPDDFITIKKAFDVLKDPKQRKRYDLGLKLERGTHNHKTGNAPW